MRALCVFQAASTTNRMEFKIEIDIRDYPLFMELKDPKQTILSILDTQHSIFKGQRSTVPTTHLSEMTNLLEKTSDKTNQDNYAIVQTMKGTEERIRHSVVEIKSTGEIVRSNVSELQSVGKSFLTTMSEFKSVHDALKELPLILSKSHTKGQVGEVCVSDFLRDALSPSDFTVEPTSTTARSGDIRVTRRDFECIVDSKFYKHTVPKKEVEKLKRDMSECKVRCGILLSLTSGVSGFKNIDMDVYTDENNKLSCVLVLSHCKDNSERILVGVKTLELVWEFFLKKNLSTFSSLAIREKSISVLTNILESVEDLRDLMTQHDKHKKNVFDSLSSFHDQLVRTIEKHTARVQEKLNSFSAF